MSSRTVKWLLLASVLLLALPVVAGASTSRVAGLGIQGDYIKDYTNVYSYLSEVSCVGNVVYGEIGRWDGDTDYRDQGVGAILGNLFDGRYGTLGIRLSESTAQLGQGDVNTSVGAGYDGSDPNSNEEHAFDLLWGKKFGKLSLGLELNRSFYHVEGDPEIDFLGGGWKEIKGDYWNTMGPENLTYNRNILGFGGGFGLEVSPTFTVEASMLYQSRTFSAEDTLYEKSMFLGNYNESDLQVGQKWENDGSTAYLMAARGLWQAQPNLLVVPVCKFYSFNADAKASFFAPDSLTSFDNPAPGAEKLSYTPLEDRYSGWQLGLAGNWTLNQNDLFVLGATLASNKETAKYRTLDVSYPEGGTGDIVYSAAYVDYDYKYTETMMPLVFAALETHVNSWLTLRFGAQQGVIYTSKNEWKDLNATGVVTEKNTTTEHYSPFTMMLGAGFKFGNLQLDATVNPDFVHNGPHFISGQTTGSDAYDYDGSALFPKVTATYTF